MKRLQIEKADIRKVLQVIRVRERLVGVVARMVIDVNRLVSTEDHGWFSFVGTGLEPTERENAALWYEMINEWDLASMSRSVVERAEEMCVIDRHLSREYQKIEKGLDAKWGLVQQLRRQLKTIAESTCVDEPLRGDMIFVARTCWAQMSSYTQAPTDLSRFVEMVVHPNRGVTHYQLKQDGYKVRAWMTRDRGSEEISPVVWRRAEAMVWTLYCFAMEEGLIGLN